MKSNLNRNISVWRGNNTPPTEYHLWIKDDGLILIKVIDGSGTAQWITKNTGDSTTIQNVNTLEEALLYLQTQPTLQILQGSVIKFKDNGKWSEYICVGTPITDQDNWKILSQENKIIDLQELADDIQELINELQIVEVSPESNNIESSYQLLDREGNNKGVTINIPKDKSIKDVQVLDTNATIDDEGNLSAGDPIGTTALCIVYVTLDGSYKLVKLDYSKFIEETEYGNGLTVQDHIISIKLNANSQTSKYIDLDQNGLGIKGIDEEIEKHTTNITSDQISDGAITTNKIASGAVTNEKLATNSVTTGKINNNAITTSKLANNSVSTDKIIDGAVTANKLADSVIKLNELPGEDETSIKTYELRINNIDQTLIGKIDIPKDLHLVDVKVSDTNATLDDSGLIVDGNPKGTTALVLSYYLEDGTYKIAKLDYLRFIEEAEIGNGLDIVDGKVVIKLDSSALTSKYLQVTDAGVGIKGIDEAIENSKSETLEEVSELYLPLSGGTMQGDLIFEPSPSSGIKYKNKTSNDLLNAAGRTTSIDEIREGLASLDTVDTISEKTNRLILTNIGGLSIRPENFTPGDAALDVSSGVSFSLSGTVYLHLTGEINTTTYTVVGDKSTGKWFMDNKLDDFFTLDRYVVLFGKDNTGAHVTDYARIISCDVENSTITLNKTLNSEEAWNNKTVCIGNYNKGSYTLGWGSVSGSSSGNMGGNIAGSESLATGGYAVALGERAAAIAEASIALGNQVTARNTAEVALGQSNNSHTGDSDSEKTAFSVGIGVFQGSNLVQEGALKNAVEIMRTGSAYIAGIGDYTGTESKEELGTKKSLQEVLNTLETTNNNSLKVNSTGLIKNNDTALTNDEKDATFKLLSRGLELLYKGLYIDLSSNLYSNYILFGKVSETFNINGQVILQRGAYLYNISACIYFAVSVTHDVPGSDTRREASFHILTNGHSPDGRDVDSNILKFKILQVTVDGEEYLAGWIPDIMGGYISIYGIQHNASKTSNVTLANTRDNTITNGDIICDRDIMYDIIGKGQLPNDFTDWGVATSDIDLNTYNTDDKLGYYIAQGGSNVTNAPDGVTMFGLLVLKSAGTNYAQILYAQSKIYYRNYTDSAWTPWADLTKDTTYNNATTTAAGLMSANDKKAVDSIAYKRHTLDLTDLDSSTFYPVVLTPNLMTLSTDCEINSLSTVGTDPYNLNRVKFSLTSKGAYDEKDTFTLWNAYNFDNDEITIGSIGHTTSGRGGTGVVFLRGGKRYYVTANATPTLYTESYTNTSVSNSPWTVAPGSAITGGTNSAVEFYWKNDRTRNTNEYINAKYGDIPLGFKTLYSANLNSSAEENDECWLLLGKLTDAFEINGILFIQRSIGGYPLQASIFLTAGRSYATDSGGVIGSYHIINTSQWDDNNYLDCKIEVITYNEEDYLAFHIPHSLPGYNLRLYGVETHTTWSGISLIRLGTSPTIVRVVSDRDNVFNTLGVDKSDLTYLVGNNTVTTLESTPVTKKLVVANLTESLILSLASDLPAGHELHIILNNNSDASITVTLPYNT